MEQPISCTIKSPVSVKPSESTGTFLSGCRVIEIVFPNMASVDIGEIMFKNYYTASLTIKQRQRKRSDPPWKTCVRRFQLMPSPHTETGSQEYFRLERKHLLEDLADLTGLRLILLQPSPMWKDFGLEDIKLFRHSSIAAAPPLSVPAWILSQKKKDPAKDVKDAPPIEDISGGLQKMWALTEQAGKMQPSSSLGRFDVDDSYELNLLSYS